MFECVRECVWGVYHVLFLIYWLFSKNPIIFVAAFILDVGRVIFGRGVYKIGDFSYTTFWLNYLINCCEVKQLVFVSFPNSTIRLCDSNLIVLTIHRDYRDSLYVTLCYILIKFCMSIKELRISIHGLWLLQCNWNVNPLHFLLLTSQIELEQILFYFESVARLYGHRILWIFQLLLWRVLWWQYLKWLPLACRDHDELDALLHFY